ncbi:MAG: cytochrome c biogenesis protein CcsA [Actinomycetota bacterium]|nr:cytochrome c biogenesis protein CcsA [Actinomycetota bacterium]
MIATAGYAAVVISLGASIALVIQGVRASATGDKSLVSLPVKVLVVASLAAFVILEIGILTHDFSILYIANNTASTTPIVFLFAGGWAALEGSIVLWGLVLAVFIGLVFRSKASDDRLGVLALGVMGAVAVFWFGLMATAANPFAVCTELANGSCSASSWWPLAESVAPVQGRGPNPLLQNHILMAVHPPMLYVGYVGLTVPFGFAIAALWLRDTGKSWLDRTHRWTLVSWIFLGSAIFLGAWWSYEVLGWGGYWAWDPVENAAILPWFAATAFLHSALVQRRRGMLQAWNFMLVIAAFSLTLLGTFLTRSGVIASVHSFTQSAVGPAILVFLLIVVIASLGLFVARARDISQPPRLDSLLSREGFILANNLLLTVLTFTVLFGTMFPLIVEALSGDEVSVARPFFDRASVPLALLLLLTIGLGAVAPWRVATGTVLWHRLRYAIATGLVAGAIAVVLGLDAFGVVVTLVLAIFVISAILIRFAEVASARPEGVVASSGKVFANDPGYWGGQVAHIGVALVAIALATTSGLAIRDTVTLGQGGTTVFHGYCLSYAGPFETVQPHRTVTGVAIVVLDEACSSERAVLRPSVNAYPGVSQPIGTPSVWTTFSEDLYVGIAGGTAEGVVLNVFIFPYQWLLWFGGFVVALGGGLAMRRKPSRRSETSQAVAADRVGKQAKGNTSRD